MLSFTQLVAKARATHGERYTYSGESKQGRYRFLHIVCKDHGEFKQVFGNHLQGKGCPACGKLENNKGVTHTLEDIRRIGDGVHFDRYTYISLDRTGRYPTLQLSCKQHGEFKQSMYNHLAGKGCPECARLIGRETLSSVTIKAAKVQTQNYEYLSLAYEQRKPKLMLRCAIHGVFTQLKETHLQGSGCPSCAEEHRREKLRVTTDKISSRVPSEVLTRYPFSDLKVVDGKSYLTITCAEHGTSEKSVDNYLRGQGCKDCAIAYNTLLRTATLKEYALKAEKVHGDLYTYLELDRTKVSYPKVLINCKEHGKFWQGTSQHLQGLRCPSCANTHSKVGTAFVDYICSLTEGVREMKSLVGSTKLRWDVGVPSKGLAFEFHGLYWHSEEHKDRSYHLSKHLQGLASGFRTIHIFEDEWVERQEAVKALLRNSLGLSCQKVFARKTKLVEVSAQTATKFLEANHIQGATSSSLYLGLSYHDELVAVLGYALRASGRGQKNSKTDAEITRYATSVKVSGGFTKLLRGLTLKEPKLTKLYTFSDVRAFTGKMYEIAGFTKVAVLPVDYFYVRYGKRQHKCTLQKSAFKKNPKLLYDPTLTERELAELNNFYRVYDCGKLKWELLI